MALSPAPNTTPVEPRSSRAHPIAISLAVAFAVAVTGGVLLAVLNPTGNADHASGHAAFALPFAILLVAIVRLWPPARPGRIPRVARAMLLVGAALVAVGQFAEAAGAFRYDGNERLTFAWVHDVGMVVGVAGLVTFLPGAALSIVVAVAARLGKLHSRWLVVAVCVAVAGALAFIAGGMIFGY